MRLKAGDKAVDFTLPGVDGEEYSLNDYKDKIKLVIFTCNHCPYAQAYEERIKKIQEDFPIQLLAINSNDSLNYPEDGFENMKIRAKGENFNFPYLRDKSQEIARVYGAEVTPDCFLIDKDNIVRYTGRVDDNYSNPDQVEKQDLREAIKSLLENKEIEVKEARAIGCSIKWKT